MTSHPLAPLRSLLLLLGSASTVFAQSSDGLSDQDVHFFEASIRPILVEHCFDCHASGADRIRGGLVLDSKEGWVLGGVSGPAIVPGDPDASLLIQSVRWEDEDFQMPPRRKLSDREIHLLEEWVRRGAPDPRVIDRADPEAMADRILPGGGVPKEAGLDHWAFQPVRSVEPPSVEDERWVEGDIDRHLLARLEAEGLRPAPDARPEDLIRRLSFDLRGLPPTPEEIRAFESDRSEDAWERLVDAYLASPEFGERWGRHWLDVARFAESSGKETDIAYPFAWRYRDWVIDALNRDMPYDDFIRAQIAGDLLPVREVSQATDHLLATGYLAIGAKSHGERNRRQFVLDVADEQIDAITQGMLGLTVSCARCHDHKYDPISQRDYYQLAGIFLSSEPLFGGAPHSRNMTSDLYTLPDDGSVTRGMSIPSMLRDQVSTFAERTRSEVERLRDEIATARQNGAGRGDDQARARLRQNTNRLALLDDLLGRYNEDGSPSEGMLNAMGTRDRADSVDATFLIRGELDQPGDVVPRGIPAIANLSEPLLVNRGSGRLDFADWIASDENPLTARVMVNRIWLHLFGAGLVESTENFGLEGRAPSHPGLLDHLAGRLVANDWSIKDTIREVVTSHAYRMSTRESARGLRVDPDNRLVWRMSPRRLEGEAIRDAILRSAGTLDAEPQDGSIVAWAGARSDSIARANLLPSTMRSVYMPILRGNIPEFLDTFDIAEPSFVTGTREKTSVPSQALFLLNDEWVHAQADAMARELLAADLDDGERVEEAFMRTLGRLPSSGEKASVRSFFEDFERLAAEEGAWDQAGGEALPERLERLARSSPARRAAIERRLRERGITLPATLDDRIVAWSAFCQSLFASAEFRYVN